MSRPKIIGVLCWYDESPTWLAGAVASVSGVVDHLVAVDGAYFLFPGSADRPSSPPVQAEAIIETAAGAGLPVTVHRNTEPYYDNEVEKRQLSIDLAAAHASSEEDWFLVFDADQTVLRAAPDLHERLGEAGREYAVAEYGVVDRTDAQEMIDQWDQLDRETDWNTDGTVHVRGLYRALDGLRYGPAHWVVSAPDDDGDPFFLWGERNLHQPYASAFDATDYLLLDHRNRSRERGRALAALSYARRRDELGVESFTRWSMEAPDGTIKPIAR